jgi:hypothetical protein
METGQALAYSIDRKRVIEFTISLYCIIAERTSSHSAHDSISASAKLSARIQLLHRHRMHSLSITLEDRKIPNQWSLIMAWSVKSKQR